MGSRNELPTDKPRFRQQFGRDFELVRRETFAWLEQQELTAFAFHAGRSVPGMEAMVVAPANAGFFALGLALLQGIMPPGDLPAGFSPRSIVYVAPPFRHTHFGGKQVVVHLRDGNGAHEMYAYNLHPGPSAKKGVYGMLINHAEREGWTVPHCSTVQVMTPYDNVVTIMHEGATGEKRYLEVPRACALHPVTDDMALCHPQVRTKGTSLFHSICVLQPIAVG